MATFKNRGHFCNYCRKILFNKVTAANGSYGVDINPAIWTVWDSNDKDLMDQFVDDLAALTYNKDADKPIRDFNNQLRVINRKYANQKYLSIVKSKKWTTVKTQE